MIDVFRALPVPANGKFSVEPESARSWRVGRSHDGFPAILVSFSDSDETGESAPRRLASFRYSPPRVVEITNMDGGVRSARLAILECRASDESLWPYFFRLVSILLENSHSTESQFDVALDSLISLFQALQQPGARTVQGLWAELAIISWSATPVTTISAWHSAHRALHDFAAGNLRLEVKSTTRSVREHVFLLDQLSSQSEGVTLIASLMLTTSELGSSVRDLIEEISVRVGHRQEVVRRLEAIVVESLGASWRQATELRFDLASARRSLRVYLASRLPMIPQPLPPEIKDVRFVLDLSTSAPLTLAEAFACGDMFRHALPDPPET